MSEFYVRIMYSEMLRQSERSNLKEV